jgi:hypothetical protein
MICHGNKQLITKCKTSKSLPTYYGTDVISLIKWMKEEAPTMAAVVKRIEEVLNELNRLKCLQSYTLDVDMIFD